MQDLRHVQFEGVRTGRGTAAPPAAQPGPRMPAAAGPPSLSAFPRDVLSSAGLDPLMYRTLPLERRVPACLRLLQVDSVSDAFARLRGEPAMRAPALSTLLIGVSSFFRDADTIRDLRAVVVPELARRPGTLRICSVGCSTGEELYTVAILLAEAGLLERASLLGTDCRPDALAEARAGAFTDDRLADLDEGLRARHFTRIAGGWRVAEALRGRIDWRAADALRALPDGRHDLVLCRNLLIYLQPPAAARLLAGLRDRLAPDGFLVLGKAERPGAALGLEPAGRSIYRRQDV